MASNQINKYVWLVDTIHRARKISFEEINRRWTENDMSEGMPIPKRTFHKWRIAIEEIFGLVIENENSGYYRYYILNDEEISRGGLRRWLVNTISVSNLLINNQSLKERIILEEVPSGAVYLPVILEAMQQNRVLHVTYQNFNYSNPTSFDVHPYCVKLFKQRWYLLARSPHPKYDRVMIYALDRFLEVRKSESRTFTLPPDFSPEDFFHGCFGVIIGDGKKCQKIQLKVSAKQSDYFRSLPLHSSQIEVEQSKEYSVFEFFLRPSFDFVQEILSHGADVEVLFPISLRNKVAEIANNMYHLYK